MKTNGVSGIGSGGESAERLFAKQRLNTVGERMEVFTVSGRGSGREVVRVKPSGGEIEQKVKERLCV